MIASHLIPVFYLQPLANESYRGKKHGLVWVYEKGQEPEERSLRVRGKQKATSQSFRTTSPRMTKPPRQRSPLLRTNAMMSCFAPKANCFTGLLTHMSARRLGRAQPSRTPTNSWMSNHRSTAKTLDSNMIRRGVACEHRFQPGFCLRPLTVQDAEVDRITYSARPGDQVLAQRSFFFRTNPQDGIARLLV